MRQLIALIALVLLACAGPPSPTADAGADAPAVSPPDGAWPFVPPTRAPARHAAEPLVGAGAPDAGRHLAAVRPPGTINQAWLIPHWYVNASTGNDRGTCVTTIDPCKTWGELVNRWQGFIVPFPQATIVTMQTDLPATDPVIIVVPATAAGSLEIDGTMTTVSTGTLAGRVQKNRASAQALNFDLAANAAGAVGLFIENGARGSGAWVDRALTGTNVLVTQPLDDATDSTEVDTWANGDAYTVQRPTKVFAGQVEGAFVYQVWLQSTSGPLSADAFERSRIDMTTTAQSVSLSNSIAPTGQMSFAISSIFGGSLTGSFLYGFTQLGSDTYLHGTILVDTGADVRFDNIYCDSQVSGGQFFVAGLLFSSGGAVYGPCLLDVQLGGGLLYTGTATVALAGSQLFFDSLTVGNAIDRSVNPAQVHPDIALTQANLDLALSSGGFGGNALSPSMHASISQVGLSTPVPSAYVAPVANGGTGLATCGSGLVVEGTGGSALSCVTPPWLTSPVALTSISPCGNGQVIETVSGVQSCVTPAAGGISCPVNLATCTTGTLAVANGGTGGTSYPTGCVVEGSGGSSPLSCITPPWLTTISGITAGGDLSGTYPNPTVAGVQNHAIGALANGMLSDEFGGAVGWRQMSGDVTTGVGTSTIPATVTGIQTRPVASTAPTAGQDLFWNGAAWTPNFFAATTYNGAATGTVGAIASGWVTMGTQAITVPASVSTVTIWAGYTFDLPSANCANESSSVVAGVGIDSAIPLGTVMATTLMNPTYTFCSGVGCTPYHLDDYASITVPYSTTGLTSGAHTVYFIVEAIAGDTSGCGTFVNAPYTITIANH
jgi:hypothetical protein